MCTLQEAEPCLRSAGSCSVVLSIGMVGCKRISAKAQYSSTRPASAECRCLQPLLQAACAIPIQWHGYALSVADTFLHTPGVPPSTLTARLASSCTEVSGIQVYPLQQVDCSPPLVKHTSFCNSRVGQRNSTHTHNKTTCRGQPARLPSTS